MSASLLSRNVLSCVGSLCVAALLLCCRECLWIWSSCFHPIVLYQALSLSYCDPSYALLRIPGMTNRSQLWNLILKTFVCHRGGISTIGTCSGRSLFSRELHRQLCSKQLPVDCRTFNQLHLKNNVFVDVQSSPSSILPLESSPVRLLRLACRH